MAKILYTIGYEGRDLDGFMEELHDHGVARLHEVRRRASSRRPGFAKGALSRRCEQEGIAYQHEPELGTPDHLRRLYKATGSLDVDAYREYLTDLAAELDRESAVAIETPTCLMCLEKDFRMCHRQVVAEQMEKRGLEVEHIA
ncbi:MAG: hypothetical protein QOJ65_2028 [Fimbriimonadaceae bacterium]|nr:hypothetical protein [Fimbriimonadaceae bacterium]